MRSQNLLIIAGHAWQCLDCQNKLLADPGGTVAMQSLSTDERAAVGKLQRTDFATVTSLAHALQLDKYELDEIMNHPRCRLRHF